MSELEAITGEDLKSLRAELDWSQADLARHWGVDRVTIINYEIKGDEPLPRQGMMRILFNLLKMRTQQKQMISVLNKVRDFIDNEAEIYRLGIIKHGDSIPGATDSIVKMMKLSNQLQKQVIDVVSAK